MMFTAHVRVTLRPSILDPQGKAIEQAVQDLGIPAVEGVRTGKFFELHVDAENAETAEAVVKQTASKLLANPVTEDFTVLALVPGEGIEAA